MYYSKSKTESGDYRSSDGSRYMLICAASAGGPLWTWFDTKEECLEVWHLTYDPLPKPDPEN